VYSKDAGSILLDGEEVEYHSARQAQEAGIAIIHQELNLIPKMTVYENVFLGREACGAFGAIDRKYMISRTRELLELVNMNLDPLRNVQTLSIAQQQMVEIAKALLVDARVIIMDEPTDALPDEEVESLFKILRSLRERDRGIVYISHRLKEVFDICDRATILRDGAFIAELPVRELTQDKLIKMMVGRTLDEQFLRVGVEPGETILSVRGLGNDLVHDISFELKRGEILGITGLVGAGRTELAQTLYGMHQWRRGKVELKGTEIKLTNPRQAIARGIYYMTEDRKRNGLVMSLDVLKNTSLSALDKISRFGRINLRMELDAVLGYAKRLNIKMASPRQRARYLSGGNQQKVILAKALMTEPEVLILDEPTRGIDVGAKKEIYALINTLKERGKGVIIISSEMPEILGMSDRILVMHEGRAKGELLRTEASQEKIMECIMA
jgi:ribose transport system ATP-binding protein